MNKVSYPVHMLTILLIVLLATQSAFAVNSMPGWKIVLRDSGQAPGTKVAAPAAFLKDASRAGSRATFIVSYHGFSAEAQAAFQYAVDIWASLISSPVPIRVDATWEPMEGNVLGWCMVTSWKSDFYGAPQGVWYPNALANKLAGWDIDTTQDDITTSFNSNFSWYFGTDGNCPFYKHDFVSVVLHELGHGLGFSGLVGYNSSNGHGWWGDGTPSYPTTFNRYVVNGSNQLLINTSLFPNPSVALGNQYTSDNLYWNGTNAKAANGGVKPKLYAPSLLSNKIPASHLIVLS